MASDRQIEANRSNAKKSTGPRSEAASGRSRLNALRHGLAVAIGTDPAFQDDIAKLANALSPSRSGQRASANARVAAEAEFDLLRIRKTRASLFETLYFANDEKLDSLAELNDRLAKLERYERRACSRRKGALRNL